jgi:hypothetical protein
MPIEAELQPCPFCGEKAVLTNVRQSDKSFLVSCVNEFCWRPATPYYDSKAAVVEAWNKRAGLSAPHETEDRERAELVSAIVAEGKSPRQVAVDVIADCRRGDGTLDEQSLLSAFADLALQRNRCAGVTIRFRNLSAPPAEPREPTAYAKGRADALRDLASATRKVLTRLRPPPHRKR